VGMFAGLTSAEYDPAITSYNDLNNKCVAEYSAHVCTAMEIENSYNYSSVSSPVLTETGMGIINNGPPGYIVFANDCNGWKVRTSTYLGADAFGAVWYFKDKKASLVRCDWLADTTKNDYKIACCK